MAYTLDSYDGAIVIDGWEKGIADSPFDGIADMRNVNIISIPGEASVNFATAPISPPSITSTITVTGLASSTLSFAAVTGLEDGMAIQFTVLGSLSGVTTTATYWVYNTGNGGAPTSAKLYSDYAQSAAVPITGTAGGATFKITNVGFTVGGIVGVPKYFVFDGQFYWMQDGTGMVWSNTKTTHSGYFTYTGNLQSGTSDNTGCGLVFWNPNATAGGGFVFAFNQTSIDYWQVGTSTTWTWGWEPGNNSVNQANYLVISSVLLPHYALSAPNGSLYYCNGSQIGVVSMVANKTFSPTDNTTYTNIYQTNIVQTTDIAICLGWLGSSLLIGGISNIVYSASGAGISSAANGDGADNYIFLAESTTQQIVTINTNAYLFTGNRGRIYTTNGTNAQLYKKVPDHISGTVEPYFTWGGTATIKNQIYFSCFATTNAGTVINQYGGVWAIDADTEALRLTNQLSYGTYAGYASAIIPISSYNSSNHTLTNPGGTGLYIGWTDGSGTNYGIDKTVSSPYTSSQATIDSDLIPIGTFNKVRDFTQVEYKLTVPMVANESITIKTRLIFNTQNTGYSTTLSDSTTGIISNKSEINFLNAQWVQFQIILNSTASSPSYTRLKQIRILGLTGPTLATNQQLEI